MKFYETGEVPKKNIEVMQEAIEEASNIAPMEEETPKKKKKKDKKRKSELNGTSNGTAVETNGNTTVEAMDVDGEDEAPKKKKKKKKSKKEEDE